MNHPHPTRNTQHAIRNSLLLLGTVLAALLLSGCTLFGGVSPVLPLDEPITPTPRPTAAVPTPRPVTPAPTLPPTPTQAPRRTQQRGQLLEQTRDLVQYPDV
jgi:hypothetical protein